MSSLDEAGFFLLIAFRSQVTSEVPGRGGGFFFGRLGNYVWASRRGGVVIPASFFHVGSVILWGGRVGQRLPQGRFGGGQVFVHSGGRLCQDPSRDMKTAALLSAFGLMRMARPAPRPRP